MVLIANEVADECRRSNKRVVVVKVEYEKAYDNELTVFILHYEKDRIL